MNTLFTHDGFFRGAIMSNASLDVHIQVFVWRQDFPYSTGWPGTEDVPPSGWDCRSETPCPVGREIVKLHFHRTIIVFT
jgi:hypothetical protein